MVPNMPKNQMDAFVQAVIDSGRVWQPRAPTNLVSIELVVTEEKILNYTNGGAAGKLPVGNYIAVQAEYESPVFKLYYANDDFTQTGEIVANVVLTIRNGRVFLEA